MIWFLAYWLASGIILQLIYLNYDLFLKNEDTQEAEDSIRELRIYIDAIKQSGKEPLLLCILLTYGFILLPYAIFEILKENLWK